MTLDRRMQGGMRAGLAIDEARPTEAGHAAMEPAALVAIARAATLLSRKLHAE
jgi:hypothetical protein